MEKRSVMLSASVRQLAPHACTPERCGHDLQGLRWLNPLSAILVGAGLCVSLSASASEPEQKGPDPETTSTGEIIIDVQSDPRYEFRRALLAGGDYPAVGEKRKRLSQEERDLLNRELREAISGIYDRGDARGLGRSVD
ncbi:hypothetical protein ACKVEX_09385 [Rhodocyclaceae bacterium SMB388]